MQQSEIWTSVLSDMTNRSNPLTVKTWLQPIKFNSDEKHNVSLTFPNHFYKTYVMEHLGDKILESIRQFLGPETIVEYIVQETPVAEATVAPANNTKEDFEQKQIEMQEVSSKFSMRFNSKYSFSNFIIGSGNQFAYAAARAVAESPASQYNPLFIYSNSGLGKTHLLHAIANRILEKDPGKRICYVHCEHFVNEVIEGIRYEQMPRIRNKYRDSFDCLLIDDIQFIANKDRSQEEFFHTFNHLVNAGKQVVITSDKVPRDIHGLEERLRSRFESGLLADIQPPDLETRIAILNSIAERMDIFLPHEVKVFIASHIKNNVRELEGAMTRLGAHASLIGSEIDIMMAKDVLKNIVDDRLSNLSIDHIQRVVCSYYKIKIQDMKGRNRSKQVALPRQIAMSLCRKFTKHSTTEIGIQFGGKDHSTVLHACQKIEKDAKEIPEIAQVIKDVENLL